MNHWRFRVKIGTSKLAHALSLLESDSLVRAYKNGRDDGLPLLILSHRNNAHIASHLIYLPIRGEQRGEKADATILLEAPSLPRPQPPPHEELPLDILSTFIDICQGGGGGGAGLGWAGTRPFHQNARNKHLPPQQHISAIFVVQAVAGILSTLACSSGFPGIFYFVENI